MRKKDEYARPKGFLIPFLVVISLLYMFGIGTWALITHPILIDIQRHVLAQLFAVCSAYQVWYWRGFAEVAYKSKSFMMKLRGPAAIYGMTLWCWLGPISPVVPASALRPETSSFVADLEKILAEYRAGLLKGTPNAQGTMEFEKAMNKAIERAKGEIEHFRSTHTLTPAEKQTLNNFVQQLPAKAESIPASPDAQPSAEAPQVVTNTYVTSSMFSKVVTNIQNNAVATNNINARTNAAAESAGGSIIGNTVTETNATITFPTVSEAIANSGYNNAASTPMTPVMPSVVSNALAVNWDALASKYPYGFNIQYQMQNYGPYNAPNGQPFSFSLVRGRPETTSLPNGSGLVFLPTLNYLNYKFSKPIHMNPLSGQFRIDGGFRLRRPWYVLPVATYIESLEGQVFVIGNGPDENWQSGLLNSIQPDFYQLDEYFPNGCYMVTSDGRELNIFKGIDPNLRGGLWSNTYVTKQQTGWLISFPPQALNGRELQTLAVPFSNQLETIKIEGERETNTVGVVFYQIQSGAVFFMGIRNN